MFFYWPIDLLIFAAFGLAMWAQYRVQSTFNKWSKVPIMSRMSGYEAARRMLDANGLHDIQIEPIRGTLTDHYDPINRVVRLSEPVYSGQSIAAVSVACHEIGHAIQHKVNYPMLVARHRIFPVTRFASSIAPLFLIAGILFSAANLVGLGIIFFSFSVLFQVITLPVEFNASARARELMVSYGFISNDEERGCAKVLNAAALTYVAAAAIAVLELVKYVMIFRQQD